MATYSESGVDIDLEAVTVSALADKLKSTLECRDIITDSGHYAALVRLGDKAIAMSTDGVGSKILIAEMMNKYDTVGIDCIAMVVNDILCVGAEPIALVDYLAVEKPDPERAESPILPLFFINDPLVDVAAHIFPFSSKDIILTVSCPV